MFINEGKVVVVVVVGATVVVVVVVGAIVVITAIFVNGDCGGNVDVGTTTIDEGGKVLEGGMIIIGISDDVVPTGGKQGVHVVEPSGGRVVDVVVVDVVDVVDVLVVVLVVLVLVDVSSAGIIRRD